MLGSQIHQILTALELETRANKPIAPMSMKMDMNFAIGSADRTCDNIIQSSGRVDET